MPYPSANELYEVASGLPDRDGALVRAAAEELVERRKSLQLAEKDTDSARQGYVARGECLARVALEAAAIADALGQRGLIDFADEVRMLARLARLARSV